MARSSAGIILYRIKNGNIEILLGHMGGPFWAKKDDHSWTIPKGEFNAEQENPLDAARREFKEETGVDIYDTLLPLKPYERNHKKHYFYLLEKDLPDHQLVSNSFNLEWPPKSGKITSFPELDRFAWFVIGLAERKITKGQLPALKQIIDLKMLQ